MSKRYFVEISKEVDQIIEDLLQKEKIKQPERVITRKEIACKLIRRSVNENTK